MSKERAANFFKNVEKVIENHKPQQLSYTQYRPKVPGLNFLPLTYQRHLPDRD
jgi:demethoxyubiquinone hydroxylase (CLK1/Coq7/Cat5 family)